MTALWDQQADGADGVASNLEAGDFASAQSGADDVESATNEGDALASSLGVTACAQSPTANIAFP